MAKREEHFLDFETPLLEVCGRIRELKELHAEGTEDLPEKHLDEELDRLHIKEKQILRRLYRNLSPWQKVQVARHQNRPQTLDYVENLIENFTPIRGDRCFGEDKAMVSGMGTFAGQSVFVLGTQKGRKTKERVAYNFGMPKPEGYRKAKRVMQMAERFKKPLITFVDTPGAFPGVEAEARGQSEAIASCIETLLTLNVPVISVITGEGGSGGALAVAVADKVLMLEHSVYSVISPEGCASILWKDARNAPQAAEALKLTTEDLTKLGIIDSIITEPVGGAHRDWELTFKRVNEKIEKALEAAKETTASTRREKFLKMTRGN